MSQEKIKLQYCATPGVQKVLDSANQMIITNDGLSNIVAGLGGSSDKRTYNQWSHKNDPFNDFSALESMYRNSWIAKQIVDIPANDATREWRKFKGKNADVIQVEEKRLNIQSLTNDWIKNARLYGGGLMLMITGQDLAKPLDLNKIQKGDLKKVLVFDRWYLSGTAINVTNPLSDNFLESEYYFLAGTGQAIHHSHICRLNGSFLPLRLNQFEQGFGDSVLRKCTQDISDVSSTQANIANLVFSANVDTIKRKGLFAALASGEDQKTINRYSKMNLLKSTINLTLLDEDETYERNPYNFAGLDRITQMQMQWISGAADIPMTRLFGSSPGGLNATGESDLNNYYDSVKSEQEGQYREGLEKLDQVMLRSAGVTESIEDVEFEWNPLYQDSNTERETQRLAAAQTDQIYLEQGVITEAQAAKRLQSLGDYDIEDADINDLESLRNEENEALKFEMEELKNQAAANEEKFNEASERADKAAADNVSTLVSMRKNIDEQIKKSKAEIEKVNNESQQKINDTIALLEKTKSECDSKIADAANIHKQEIDNKVADITAQFESDKFNIQSICDEAISDLKTQHKTTIDKINDEKEIEISNAKKEHDEITYALDQKVIDAEKEAIDKVKLAEEERDQAIADAELNAKETINEAKEQNVADIKAITDDVNNKLADQKSQYDSDLQSVKDESNQLVDNVITECIQKIEDAEVKSKDLIEQLQKEFDQKIIDSTVNLESLETAIMAKAYKCIKDAQTELNQDDEASDDNQQDGSVDGSNEAEPRDTKVYGEAEIKDENTEADGAE